MGKRSLELLQALVLAPSILLTPLCALAGPTYYTVTEVAYGRETSGLVDPAINSLGQSAGGVYSPDQIVQAFMYSNGTKVYLGPTPGAPRGGTALSAAVAINNLGEVAGWTTVTASYGYKAFLYSNGSMQVLGTFASSLDTESVSVPTDINNLGQVVGYATASAGGQNLAFLYSNGDLQDIGTLGGQFSSANGINDSSEVVGVSDTAKSGFAGSDAFLYISGSMYNLNSLIGSNDSAVWLTSAVAINNQGQILADGVSKYNHEPYTYLLTPTNTPPTCGALCEVSEPGTLALFGMGLTGLGLALHRRIRQDA